MVTLLLIFPVVFVSLSYVEDLVETNLHGASQGIVSIFANLPKQAIALASQTGYAGIFALMLAEAAAFPIPSEIILPFAGYLVYSGTLEFWPVIAITTVAAIFGSYVDYFLGVKLGQRLLTNESKIVFLRGGHLRKAESWFSHYGPIAVALFRLVPGARVLISFPAGLYRMNKLKFGMYTLAGCLPWNIALTYLGWWLGSSWGSVVEAFRYINLIVYALMIIFVAWVAWRLRIPKGRRYE
jgi:membrane protein DedA with SNARE-associated domain